MAVKRYALINSEGICVNTILLDLDANPNWAPPEGFTLEHDDKKEKDPSVSSFGAEVPRTTQKIKTPPPLGQGKGL